MYWRSTRPGAPERPRSFGCGSSTCGTKGFAVTTYNAWDTDFTGDPLLALSTELLADLENSRDSRASPYVQKLKDEVPKLLRAVAPSILSAATHGVLDLTVLQEPGERVDRYKDGVKQLRRFSGELQAAADALSECHGNKPLIVLIDETDRCRPSYAVELLEIAKHLFSVRHVVFALAVNRSELEHSVKALYGQDFDAHGYLRRFLDIDFRLPDPDRGAFVDAMLDAAGINNFLNRTNSQEVRHSLSTFRRMLKGAFSLPQLSLRQVAQAIHRLGLVFASLSENQRLLLMPAAAALILRTLDARLYQEFVTRQFSADQVIGELYKKPAGAAFSRMEGRTLFEAILLVSQGESTEWIQKKCAKLEEQDEPDDAEERAAWRHQQELSRTLRSLDTWRFWKDHFSMAVKRLELFSEDLA
ncbi:KAP family P-loop NTPase fold protein [Candidatus Palauibacter sp.]|uniref:KAP family P-loop NTPase fold protein n=1 Tax=Candidatus Palauibacter sp. TaxID=3101350 RepID=UPI003B51F1F2